MRSFVRAATRPSSRSISPTWLTGGSLTGSTGSDILVAGGTSLNLTSTVTTSFETIRAGSSLATTFTVDAADLASGGSVVGSSGDDTLIIASTAYNLASTSLSSIEKLQAGLSTATTFTLDQADLIAGGSIIGSSGSDILVANGTTLDLSSTALDQHRDHPARAASRRPSRSIRPIWFRAAR